MNLFGLLIVCAFLALARFASAIFEAENIELVKEVNEGWDLYSEIFAEQGQPMTREQVKDGMEELIKIYSAQTTNLMKPRVLRLRSYLDCDEPKNDNCDYDLKDLFKTTKEHRKFKVNMLPYLTGCVIKQVDVCKDFIESYKEPPVVADAHGEENPKDCPKELKEEVFTLKDIAKRARIARDNNRSLEFDPL